MKQKTHLALEKLVIVDEDGRPRIVATTDPATSMPIMRFQDQSSNERLVIKLDLSGNPEVAFLSDAGATIIQISVDDKATSGISMFYFNGQPAFRLSMHSTNRMEMTLFDISGKIVWSTK